LVARKVAQKVAKMDVSQVAWKVASMDSNEAVKMVELKVV